VESAGGVTPLPLAGGEQYAVGSYGRVGDPDDVYRANKADFKSVIPGYFETMGIELLGGRFLEPSDNRLDALDVAVVDENLVERLFGSEDPLGKEILVDHFNEQTFSLERLPVQVVGVVGNVRSTSLAAEGRETIYVPYVFSAFLPITFVARTTAEPTALIAGIRDEVTAMDPDVPISSVATLGSYVSQAMAPTRFMLALIGVFAGLALVLASLGLYGVISYSARQRTREIGVRVAFGASEGDVVRLVLFQGMVLAMAGIVLGLGASFALGRVVRSLLVGVSAWDPVTYVGVPLLLLGIALVAAWIPARRASGVDPVVALRDE
jgi:putative ABC transport system permease protein